MSCKAGRPAPLRRPDSEDGDSDDGDSPACSCSTRPAAAEEAPPREDATMEIPKDAEGSMMAVAPPVSSDLETLPVVDASSDQLAGQLAMADEDEDEDDVAAAEALNAPLFDIEPEVHLVDKPAVATDLDKPAAATDLDKAAMAPDLDKAAMALDLDKPAVASDLDKAAMAADLDKVAMATDLARTAMATASDLAETAKALDVKKPEGDLQKKPGQDKAKPETKGDTITKARPLPRSVGSKDDPNFRENLEKMLAASRAKLQACKVILCCINSADMEHVCGNREPTRES